MHSRNPMYIENDALMIQSKRKKIQKVSEKHDFVFTFSSLKGCFVFVASFWIYEDLKH